MLDQLRNDPDPEAMQRMLEEDPKVQRLYIVARELGLQTLTFGVSPNIAGIEGRAIEWGISLDTLKRFPADTYEATTRSRGPQVALGVDAVVSALDVTNSCIGGEEPAYGISLSADLGAGGGVVLWYVGDGEFVGFSVPLAGGSIGGGLAGLTTETRMLFGDEDECEAQEIAVGLRPPPPATKPPGTETEPVKIGPATVEVVQGDTLWAISSTRLGDPFRYPDIFALNAPPLTDPDLIRPGQVLALPKLGATPPN
jgi:hypothetical protein